MANWNIEYWDNKNKNASIEAWFDSLTKEAFTSVAKELKLLEMCGNTLRLPHSRALGSGLFELRDRKFGYRIYYTFFKNHLVILLHAGEKKSQQKDIQIARHRLTEFLLLWEEKIL